MRSDYSLLLPTLFYFDIGMDQNFRFIRDLLFNKLEWGVKG